MQEKPRVEEKVSSKQDEIFGGEVDDQNDATVFVYAINGQYIEQCSGTLIAVNQSYGYILTAQHCEGMQYIKFGTNAPQQLDQPDFQVEQDYAAPGYLNHAGDPHDLRILRFVGANPSMTVVPVAVPPDGVTTQTSVDLSGYGLTEVGDSETRRHVVMNVSNTDESFIYVNQQGGQGTCSGDSGGPWYASVGGVKSVVAVTSWGDVDCAVDGAGARVSLDYDWIQGIIGGAVPPPTCGSCFDSATSDGGACASEVDACFADAACSALNDCYSACPDGDNVCYDGCDQSNPGGIAKFNAITECTVCGACASVCDTSGCGSTPTTTDAAATSGAGGSPAAGGAGGGAAADGHHTTTVTTCAACTVGSTDDASGALAALVGVAALGLVVARRRR
ncbi:MAG: trypsin-like serine protease [Polyangiaceae bacterium]